VTYGGSRENILRRLRVGGFNSLASQVVAGQMSARKASLLAGFGDRRVRVRRGERVITELEFEQLHRRLRLAEQRAERLQKASQTPRGGNSPTSKIDARALIG
jgi:hypothetical protein